MEGVGKGMGKERRRRARKEDRGSRRSRTPSATDMHPARASLGQALH